MRKKRKTYNPEEKARIVLELLREESTLNEVSSKYSISPQLISRWKMEILENMPVVFDKKSSELENLKKEHAAEKEELINQIGQLTADVNWLKKKQQQVFELKKRKP